MGVLNNFNLSGSGSNSLTQQIINQNPNILYSSNPVSYSPSQELTTSILNNSPNTLLSGTGISSLLGSANQYAQSAQSWLNGYEVNNNLPVTSIESGIGGALNGLAQLVNSVGGVMAMKNGVLTGYANPYINGQATTYNRTTGQPINPVTGQPIPNTQFPWSSALLLGGGIIALVLLSQML